MRYVSYRMYRYFLVILAKPYLPVFFSNTGCCYHYPAMCVCVCEGGGGGEDEVWDRETLFSQLAKWSPCVVVSG